MNPRIADIKERLAKATPGEWKVFDSCSWRRIGISGTCKTVIAPTNCPSDNHLDLYARREDLELAAHAPADLAFLLSELDLRDKVVEAAQRLLKSIDDDEEGEGRYDVGILKEFRKCLTTAKSA